MVAVGELAVLANHGGRHGIVLRRIEDSPVRHIWVFRGKISGEAPRFYVARWLLLPLLEAFGEPGPIDLPLRKCGDLHP